MSKLNNPFKFSHKVYLYSLAALILTAVILLFPAQCMALALNGLRLWYEKMIPALFPFMVLSGVIIRMDLTETFVKVLDPVLGRLFQVRNACIYGMTVGFLCGFPMGAHTAAQLCGQKKISRQEASFLLFFCNNIGPVYFLSFVMPTLSLKGAAPFLAGMYGLPFLYGLFLRYTLFRNTLCRNGQAPGRAVLRAAELKATSEPVSKVRMGKTTDQSAPPSASSLLAALDESVFASLAGIARLGGYMVFFNLLFILPTLLAGALPLSAEESSLFIGGIGCLLEITGGIGIIGNRAPLLVLCVLPFGGLSCIAQTYSMIRRSALSIREYVMHKMILTAVTVFYYLLLSKALCSGV